MPRVKGGTTKLARRKKILKQAKGYFGSKHRLYRTAKEQVMHSGVYAYRDRRQNKRNFRKLWITRINAACRLNDMSYSRFVEGLNKAGILINRKMLSEIAINDAANFTSIVNLAKAALEGTLVAEEVKAPKKEKTVKVEKNVEEVTEEAPVKKAAAKKVAKEVVEETPVKKAAVKKETAPKKEATKKATVKKTTKKVAE
jgi:large subunit ribosomal protein L20